MATSTTHQKAKEITPVYCCTIYFVWIILPIVVFLFATGLLKVAGEQRCYLELFTHSVAVSNSTANANVSTADWSFGFVGTSPVTSCKISLYTIKSRLLRGQEIVAESSPSLGFFGQFAASYRPDWTITNLGFENVVTPEVLMGDVVWDVRVEIVARMKKDAKFRNGHRIIMSRYGSHQVDDFLMVVCRDIPVKFTVDSTGNKMGSLLGNMRRCDYTTVDNFDNSDYWNYNN